MTRPTGDEFERTCSSKVRRYRYTRRQHDNVLAFREEQVVSDSTAIFSDASFWQWLYLRKNDEPLADSVLRLFDSSDTSGSRSPRVDFSFPCDAAASLVVSINPEFEDFNLSLHDGNTDTEHPMGWWDWARWHPHALRWDELQKLENAWRNTLPIAGGTSPAFLLLAQFVGHANSEQDEFAERKSIIREHYRNLSLFSESELTELTDATLVRPSNEDYEWTLDDELGWVFGGEYPCYSLRNRPHFGGSEGRFPFAKWNAIVERL